MNYYWRKDSFEELNSMIERLNAFPQWEGYSRYCELKEKGLRKQGLGVLREFIQHMLNQPLEDRIVFVNWLEEMRERYSKGYDLVPTPLQNELIEPTIELWIAKEPKNPIPYRWQNTIESLNKAIELDSSEQIARLRLYNRVISRVDYNQHELLHYGYIGNAAEDLELLRSLRKKLQGLKKPYLKEIYTEIDARLLICEGWSAYIEQDYDSYQFPDFLQRYAPDANIDDIL